MAKLYSKNTWTDEVLANAAKYLVKDDNGDTVYNQALIELATEVITAGSPVNALRMNNIENGIDALDDEIVTLNNGIDALDDEIVTLNNGIVTLNNLLQSGYLLSNIRIYTASNIWTKVSGLRALLAFVLAAGGGGGGCSAASGSAAAAGGGGPGGVSWKFILAAALNATETVTVGLGGPGGPAGANNGTNGEASSFGSHLTASGGVAGIGDAAGTTVPRIGGSGNDGGTGSNGDINWRCDFGQFGIVFNTSSSIGGSGGNSPYGAGGRGRLNNLTPQNGLGYGSGGAGAATANSTTPLAGGNGANGLVILYEFM